MSRTIVIEKGIAPPNQRRGRPAIYPWRTMEIGDSFFVPSVTTARFGGSMRNGMRNGRKFISAAAEKDGIAGVRIWRVA